MQSTNVKKEFVSVNKELKEKHSREKKVQGNENIGALYVECTAPL